MLAWPSSSYASAFSTIIEPKPRCLGALHGRAVVLAPDQLQARMVGSLEYFPSDVDAAVGLGQRAVLERIDTKLVQRH